MPDANFDHLLGRKPKTQGVSFGDMKTWIDEMLLVDKKGWQTTFDWKADMYQSCNLAGHVVREDVLYIASGKLKGECYKCGEKVTIPRVPGGMCKSIVEEIVEKWRNPDTYQDAVEQLVQLKEEIRKEREVLEEAEEIADMLVSQILAENIGDEKILPPSLG